MLLYCYWSYKRLLALSKRQLKGYRERGQLGYTVVGNKVYYRRDEVEKLIKKHITRR